MRRLALLLALLPLPAAACPGGAEVFSCTIKGKTLQLCHLQDTLVYSFGPADRPELSIVAPLETLAYTPWPGVGGTIWESVAFPNQGHTYEVWTSAEHNPDLALPLQGGVTILKGESIVAQLTCDQGTASNPLDPIFDLKDSIGQCWDFEARTWTTVCE